MKIDKNDQDSYAKAVDEACEIQRVADLEERDLTPEEEARLKELDEACTQYEDENGE